ncbi:hypothetical protein [Limnobacter parvus]|uniref:hypothetical protein n=1 Tax=Limnobacter parvus TaxID=2939690 RepID=UPI00214AA16F|nr:hypothetical protein [Limnobacter parvus]
MRNDILDRYCSKPQSGLASEQGFLSNPVSDCTVLTGQGRFFSEPNEIVSPNLQFNSKEKAGFFAS